MRLVVFEPFDDAVMADRLGARGSRGCVVFLNQCLRVPDEVVAPDASRRLGMPIDDGQIHPLGSSRSELLFQSGLRSRILWQRARRPMCRDRCDGPPTAFASRAIACGLRSDRRSIPPPTRRSSGTASRPAGLFSTIRNGSSYRIRSAPDGERRRASLRASRTIFPDANFIALLSAEDGFRRGPDFGAIDEHLAARARFRRPGSRSEPARCRQNLSST